MEVSDGAEFSNLDADADNGIQRNNSAPRKNMPLSFRDYQYASDDMHALLALENPDDVTPAGLEKIQYVNSNIFPEWLLSDSEWKKTKINTNAGNTISEILQLTQAQRSHDQTSTLVHWLMSVWETANTMGYAKCANMFKEFKYFKFEAGDNIITEGERGLTFYIIISGETVVHKDGIGIVSALGKGKSFGEIALSGKDVRTATIRAVTQVEVLSLHKVDYDHFVRDIQDNDRREHYHLLRDCKLFDRWTRQRVERMANTCKRMVFEEGAYVFHQVRHSLNYIIRNIIVIYMCFIFQGDPPDFVYIIFEGSVDIVKEVKIVCKNRLVSVPNGAVLLSHFYYYLCWFNMHIFSSLHVGGRLV